MEWISKLLDINRIPTRIIILIWLISGLLLFIPENFLNSLNLTDFKVDYGKYFGIIFLTASAFLILLIFTWLLNKLKSKRLESQYKSIIRKNIINLDPYEKSVIREFFLQSQNTLKIPLDNPTVSGLIRKHIIYQVGQYGEMSRHGMLFNFSITEYARENLTNDLIDLPRNEPTQDEIEKLKNSRPPWYS